MERDRIINLSAPEFATGGPPPEPAATPIGSIAAAPSSPLASINLAELNLGADYGARLDVKQITTHVPVRNPGGQEYVRSSSDPTCQLDTYVIELKEERETYLVAPALWPALAAELVPKTLVLAVNRQGIAFIWPLRLPRDDRKPDAWMLSAREGAQRATKRWVRMTANMSLGAYQLFEAGDDLPPPKWPAESFQQLIEIAFRGRYITDLDHPVLKRLRGEA